VASTAKAKLGALFLNAQTACPLCITLEELDHLQPMMPLQTDNSTACGIINDTVKQKQSKAIKMQFYWIRDQSRQGQFHIFWCPGGTNQADYFSKHHPIKHCQDMQPVYLRVPQQDHNYYTCLIPQPLTHPGEGVLIAQPWQSCSHHKIWSQM